MIGSMAYLPGSVPDSDNLSEQLDALYLIDGDNERGDANKFHPLQGKEGYLFTFDDDIIYPPDYVERMKEWVDHFCGAVSWSGKTLGPTPDLYDNLTYRQWRCNHVVPAAVPVDVVGTGCMAWHSSLGIPPMEIFTTSYMADIHFSVWASEMGLSKVVVPHEPIVLNPREGPDLWHINKTRYRRQRIRRELERLL